MDRRVWDRLHSPDSGHVTDPCAGSTRPLRARARDVRAQQITASNGRVFRSARLEPWRSLATPESCAGMHEEKAC